MCLFLMCSCDNHDFELSEKEQVFYINQMLHFSIDPWDSLSKAYSYDFFLRNPKPCKEVDTIYLERKIPNKFKVIESSSYTREYNLDPSFIKLLPNTQYIVAHTGMGARVNIFKYYWRTRQTLWRAVQMLTQKLCCQTIHDCPKVVPLHYESE